MWHSSFWVSCFPNTQYMTYIFPLQLQQSCICFYVHTHARAHTHTHTHVYVNQSVTDGLFYITRVRQKCKPTVTQMRINVRSHRANTQLKRADNVAQLANTFCRIGIITSCIKSSHSSQISFGSRSRVEQPISSTLGSDPKS